MSSDASAATGPDGASPLARVTDAAILLAIAFPQLFWSWRRWADPLVDFGRELYVPWRLAAGEVLYRDIAHLNGPVSMSWHAALFRMFGASYSVVIASNLVVVALITLLLYIILFRVSRLSGLMAAGAFLSFFAFAHYTGIGNYTYMSPYAHEATHGLLFALVALLALDRSIRSGRAVGFLIAGFAIGFAILTKAEIALAVIVAAAAAVVLVPRGGRLRASALVAIAAIVPYAAWVTAFARYMSWRDAATSVLGSIWLLARSEAGRGIYYTSGMGLDTPLRNAGISALHAALLGAGIALAAWSSRRVSIPGAAAMARLPHVVILATLAVSGVFVTPARAGRCLAITTIVILALAAFRVARRRDDPNDPLRVILLFGAFAFALLAKMILFPRVYHYGFVLAMPAGALLVVTLAGLVPRRLDESGRGGRAFAVCALAFFCCSAQTCIGASKWRYSLKNTLIGSGDDRIIAYDPRVDARSAVVVNALDWIERNVPPTGRLVALPGGSMLNYLSRRRGGRHVSVMPPEQNAFGEERMVEDLRAEPPEVVLLVSCDAREYGVGPFGRDSRFGALQMAWIERNYRAIGRFGLASDQGAGIEVFQRIVR